jgi:hypothetical protein
MGSVMLFAAFSASAARGIPRGQPNPLLSTADP